MKTQGIPRMGTVEWSSTREWHARMVNGQCQRKPCRAEIAAENEARKATIDALIGAIEFDQAAESAGAL